jgi:hypothetical protein
MTTTDSSVHALTGPATFPPSLESGSPAEPSPGDRLAERLLAGPVTVLLGLVCLVQLLTWIPHYLTWPLWADHDAYATIARGWEAGVLPYRDLYCNQFPGAIYLFWILGKLAGWGGSAAIYAFDAGAMFLLGIGMVLWSQRLFGRMLPGIVGYLSFLSYYLALDYSHAAQRDWHAPLLAVLGIFILQTSRGRILAPAVAGMAMSLAICIRPHAVLFVPVVAFQFLSEFGAGWNARRVVSWLLSFVLATVVWILPLAASGILPDFVAGVSHNNSAPDGRGLHAAALIVNVLKQFDTFSLLAVSIAVCMIPKPDRRLATAAVVWLGALALSLLYEPISPRYHAYLRIPLHLMFAVNVAVLTHLLVTTRRIPASFKMLAFLLVLGVSCRIRPEFCTIRPSLKAAAAEVRGKLPDGAPPGYRRGLLNVAAYYPWADYRAMLNYLQPAASKHTKIANALKGDPAVVGLLGGFSAFPAENISWLRMVNRNDEGRFAQALEHEPDSVVVWSPGEAGPDPTFTIAQIESTIRRHYEPDARFGVIEVWRRKGTPALGTAVATQPARRSGVGG